MSAAALPMIAMAAQAGGQIVQGISANKSARRQAKIDEENARLAILEGEEEADNTRRDERGLAGDMLVAMAAGGGDLQGSNLDLIAQSAYQRELEIESIRRQRRGEARNLEQSASANRRAGSNALIGAGFGALSSVINGVSSARSTRLLRAQNLSERSSFGGMIKMPKRSGIMPDQQSPNRIKIGGTMNYLPRTLR